MQTSTGRFVIRRSVTLFFLISIMVIVQVLHTDAARLGCILIDDMDGVQLNLDTSQTSYIEGWNKEPDFIVPLSTPGAISQQFAIKIFTDLGDVTIRTVSLQTGTTIKSAWSDDRRALFYLWIDQAGKTHVGVADRNGHELNVTAVPLKTGETLDIEQSTL